MQSSSLLCSPNFVSSTAPTISTSIRFRPLVRPGPFHLRKLPLHNFHTYTHAISHMPATAFQEIVETSKGESEFIEIGYISSVHGLQGEMRVKPKTGFEELRLSTPGKRWLKQKFSGIDAVREVELVEGRGHPGQKSWILRFNGIDTVDQARLLVGSSVLVKEEDRPELEESEFYTRDLVGMKVVLKETGDLLGTVANVFDSGGNDLLQVLLELSPVTADEKGKPESEMISPARHVWIPFVEAIVPDVDMDKREMLVTPPKGLLELNLRSDERSKKERRQLEWKERKKFQRRLIAAKKKLCEMEQQHVFNGFGHGDKDQTKLLSDHILSVNSKLLQQALQHIVKSSDRRWSLSEFISVNSANLKPNSLSLSEKCISPRNGIEKQNSLPEQEKGIRLTSQGKVAIVLCANDQVTKGLESEQILADADSAVGSSHSFLEAYLQSDESFMKLKDRESIPLIVVCPAGGLESLKQFLLEYDYFGFDSQKLWFLEEEKLPVITNSQKPHKPKILMKSPWEIHQSSVGPGGVLSLLSSEDILENLDKLGVEFVEVCSVNGRPVGGYGLLPGLLDSRRGDVGVQISADTLNTEEDFDIIFSMKFMKKLAKHIDKLQFLAIPKPYSHVEKVDKEWVDVVPSSPNSYELYCSIYNCLEACPIDKVCILYKETLYS